MAIPTRLAHTCCNGKQPGVYCWVATKCESLGYLPPSTQLIDRVVYRLYGLIEEEIAIVEDNHA